MNGYPYPQQHQQHSPTAGTGAINPAMLAGVTPAMLHNHNQGPTSAGAGGGPISPSQLLARQGLMGGISPGARMGMGMGMAGMNNIDMMNNFKGIGMGGMDAGPTINPAMLGAASSSNAGLPSSNNVNANSTINPAMMLNAASNSGSNSGPTALAGMSPQDLQKAMAQRQALSMNGMNGTGGMNSMGGMGGGSGNMSGMGMNMGMGMGMMGGVMTTQQQQHQAMQQYLVQQQLQQQQAHTRSQNVNNTNANPYPPVFGGMFQSPSSFPNHASNNQGQNAAASVQNQSQAQAPNQAQSQIQSQGQAQSQNAMNQHQMAPPPRRPSTAMSSSSQASAQHTLHAPPRPPTAMGQHSQHQSHSQLQQQQSAQYQQQQQQQAQQTRNPMSRPGTASGFPPASVSVTSPGAQGQNQQPNPPQTPQMQHQQHLQQFHQQHLQQQQQQQQRELSRPPSRPQTAGSNHGGTPSTPVQAHSRASPDAVRGMGSMGNMGGLGSMSSMGNMGNMANMNANGVNGMGGIGGLGGMSGMGGMGGMNGVNGMNSKFNAQFNALPLGMVGMGGMPSMSGMPAGIGGMSGLGGMGGGVMPLMGGAGGGMMPPPTLPRQGSLGPGSQHPAQAQAQQIHTPGHGLTQGPGQSQALNLHHGSPTPMSRAPSVGEQHALSSAAAIGMGGGMSGGMVGGVGDGLNVGDAGGPIGMGTAPGVGMNLGMGMSPMQMQTVQERRAIAQAALMQQQAQRLQTSGGANPNLSGINNSGGGFDGLGQSHSVSQSLNPNVNMGMGVGGGMGMNVGMNINMPNPQMQGTPTRPPPSVAASVAVGRGSVPPPVSSMGMAMMGMSGGTPLPGTPVRPSTGLAAGSSAGLAPSVEIQGAPPNTTGSSADGGLARSASINGITSNADVSVPSVGASASVGAGAAAAGLPPLPTNVHLNPAMTRMSMVPLAESQARIPELNAGEVAEVAGWLATDRAYESRYRAMAARAKAELTMGPVGARPRWWERDPAVSAARRKDKFNLDYPYVALAREGATRKRGKRREGLKVPGRLKKEEADRAEQLVPIRLEFDVEHHKYRDSFVWNLNDPIVTPEAFAQSVIDDYGLSLSYHSTITKSIQEQLSDFKAHSATLADVDGAVTEDEAEAEVAPRLRGTLEGADRAWWTAWRRRLRNRDGYVRTRALLQSVPEPPGRAKKRRKCAAPGPGEVKVASVDEDSSMDVEMFEVDEDKMHEEMRIVIKLDVTVGEMKLDDQFEWDIENAEPTPEQFAEIYSSDLGLAGEFRTAIAHAIREQVATYQKSLFLVGHPSDGSAVQDDDLRMSFLPSVTSVARSVDQTQSYQPIINYLSDGELDRLDKEREKEANKRRKRNTRGRRGIALPDREPLRTHRTPAIGFPEVDPSTLALAVAAAAPTSRRAAAAAASVTIANMVASENGTAIIPPVSTTPTVPAAPLSKIPKAKGSFKAPKYPSSLLKARANVTTPTHSTVADTSTFEPPLEGDLPLPVSSTSVSAPDSRASKVVTARRQRELEKEAKEREFADGQRANMIDGVWHCSNCGCPDNIAIGRRKGPLGDKSQCGACGKFWHRHRRPRPVEYSTDPEYHINLKMEAERVKASAKKRGGAAALRALNIQQDQTPTPASVTDDQSSPTVPKHEVWVEIKSPKKTRPPSPASEALGLLERPLSPASSVSSSASERPLAQTVLQTNGAGTTGSKPASSATTPLKAPAELPAVPKASTSTSAAVAGREPAQSEPLSASGASVTPAPEAAAAQSTPPPRPTRPQWQEDAMAEMQERYPNDRFDIILRKSNNGNPSEWRVKCLDCPGKLYTPGPGETLTNFEVHLKNRQHRGKVTARVSGSAS